MNIDLFAALALLVSVIFSGPPDDIVSTIAVRAHFEIGTAGTSCSLSIAYDPTFVRYEPAPPPYPWDPEKTCGLSDGYSIWVYPDGKNCFDTFEHEMKHVRQRQAFGTLGVLTLQAIYGKDFFESYPRNTADNMLTPLSLNYPLLEISIPCIYQR